MVGRIRDPLTGAVLRASGKKDSRNEDRDANPMNDAIPGEVVRRSEKFEKSGPSTKALAETDITAVLSKGSGTREKWLKKALQQVSDGELQAVDIYNILKVPDFAADLKEKTGRSMYKFLMSRISVFSKGQQRFLSKECPLAQQFGGGGAAEPMVDDSKQNPEAAEEMMARVRQFVRQQQGVELDQAVAGIAPVPAVPAPPPAAPAALVPPAVRQDMSAVANIIARASNTAVNYQAAAAVAAPPAPVLVPVAPVAAPVSAPVSAIREEKASSESEVRQREPSSSASRRKSKKTRKNRSRSRDRRRR